MPRSAGTGIPFAAAEVFEHAGGVADVESKAACTPATNFRIASISKQFTAMSVLLLAGRGKLSLDDEVAKFIPGWADHGYRKLYQPRSMLWFGGIFFTLFAGGLAAVFWLAATGRLP